MGFLHYIGNPKKLFLRIGRKWMPDELFIKLRWDVLMDYKLDLKNPKSYNEKLQWLKLHEKDYSYTRLVDKYEVKKFVSNKIGNQYIIPTLGVWDNWEDIDFQKLPSQFVLKCTHDSGGVFVCKDKNTFDFEHVRKRVIHCLKTNFYYLNREYPYKNVKPRIIAEEYVEDSKTKELRDYKFFTFDGEVNA
jgi:hypothetical protein